MNIKTPLREFCEERMMSDSIQKSFGAYILAEMGKKFNLDGSGETVHLMLSRVTQEQLADYWQTFVNELKNYLLPTSDDEVV
jgi:hypothetical protein